MKIKFLIPALLLCFFIFPSKSYAFEAVNDTYSAKVLHANMFSSYTNNEFHIPPHSDDSTVLHYYYPLNDYVFGFDGGRFFLHSNSIPQLIVNQNNGSKISFVYTLSMNLVVAGNKYPLAAGNKVDSTSTVLPYWTSADIYEWGRETYIEYVVNLTYTNMDSESILASFDLSVPQINVQILPLNYSSPILYLHNLSYFISNGFHELQNKLDTLNTTITNKFSDMFDQMEEQHNELLNGFDDSTGNQINSDFNDTVADLDEAEDNLFALAENEINYSSYADFFRLSSVEGAIGFVSSWMQSIYVSLGVFGMPILIGLLLIVVTRIIGYQNFSAGGG